MGTKSPNSTLQMKKEARVDTPTSEASCAVTLRIGCDKIAHNGFISLWFEGTLANSPDKPQNLVLNIIPTIILTCEFTAATEIRDTSTLSLKLSEPGAVFGPTGTDSLRPFDPDDSKFHSFVAICKSTIISLNFSRHHFEKVEITKISSISRFLRQKSVQPRCFEHQRHNLAPKHQKDFEPPAKLPPYREKDVFQQIREVQPPAYREQPVDEQVIDEQVAGKQVVGKRRRDTLSTPPDHERRRRLLLPSPKLRDHAEEPNTPGVLTEPNTPSTHLSISSFRPTCFAHTSPDHIEDRNFPHLGQAPYNAPDDLIYDTTSSSEISPSQSIRPTFFTHAPSPVASKHKKLLHLSQDPSHIPDEPIYSIARSSHTSPSRSLRPTSFIRTSCPDPAERRKLESLKQGIRNAPDELLVQILKETNRGYLLALPTDKANIPTPKFEFRSTKAATLDERIDRLIDQKFDKKFEERMDHYLEFGDSQFIEKLTECATSECREQISDEFKTRGVELEEELESSILEVRQAVGDGLEDLRKQQAQCEHDIKDLEAEVVAAAETAAKNAVSNISTRSHNTSRQSLLGSNFCPLHWLGANTRRSST
ncbi:hypothetical protein CBS147311_237 [Penicillium roqueforti]|nr:hypothetical protein CBS147311_237 [Penicillium roqueforti]